MRIILIGVASVIYLAIGYMWTMFGIREWVRFRAAAGNPQNEFVPTENLSVEARRIGNSIAMRFLFPLFWRNLGHPKFRLFLYERDWSMSSDWYVPLRLATWPLTVGWSIFWFFLVPSMRRIHAALGNYDEPAVQSKPGIPPDIARPKTPEDNRVNVIPFQARTKKDKQN